MKSNTELRRAEPNQLQIDYFRYSDKIPSFLKREKQVEAILPSSTVRISVRLLSSLVSRRGVRQNVRRNILSAGLFSTATKLCKRMLYAKCIMCDTSKSNIYSWLT